MATIVGFKLSPDSTRGRPRDPFYDEIVERAATRPDRWLEVKCVDLGEVRRVVSGLRKRQLAVAIRGNVVYAQYLNGNGN